MKVSIASIICAACLGLVGCGKSDVPVAATGPGASGSVASPTEGNSSSNVKTVSGPQTGDGGPKAYKIVPPDPSKFPSNAAGGDH